MWNNFGDFDHVSAFATGTDGYVNAHQPQKQLFIVLALYNFDLRFDLEAITSLLDILLFVPGTQKTKMPDANELVRQDVAQEAADELARGKL